jgi:hypothetical protein
MRFPSRDDGANLEKVTPKAAAMPKTFEQVTEARRALLVRALAAGAYVAGMGLAAGPALAQVLGKVPRPLPRGQSFYEVDGVVRVNGQPARIDTRVGPNDVVETGRGARAIFVVGTEALLLRGDSRLEMQGTDLVVSQLRLLTGAVLSVFGRGNRTIIAPTSTIGIRGTGVYVEAQPDLTYVCTCYGTTDIAAADDPKVSEQVTSVHHDKPRYVLGRPDKGRRIVPAPFKNHTDLELTLIESLVGRTPPFSLFDESYGSPRRY